MRSISPLGRRGWALAKLIADTVTCFRAFAEPCIPKLLVTFWTAAASDSSLPAKTSTGHGQLAEVDPERYWF